MKRRLPQNRYFVLRHGFSEANERGLVVSDLQRGQAAFGLTAKGREQVRKTVTQAHVQGQLDNQVQVVCSPFLRAVETAQLTTEILRIPHFTRDERLRERFFGSFELGPDTNYPCVWDQDRRDPTHTQWGVESVKAEVARVESLVGALERLHRHQRILLVTHGDIASLLLCWAAGENLSCHREVGALATAGLREVTWLSH